MSVRSLTVSIIVPVYKGGEDFRRCVAALVQLWPPPLEILVVVDGADFESAEVARDAGLEVLQMEYNCGPAVARNAGASVAKGELFLFLDADILPPADTVARVCEVFQQEPRLTAIFGSYDDQPSAENFLSQYRNLLHHYVHQHSLEQATTFWSGCGAVRRDVFLGLGGFSTVYKRPSVEDIELGYRLTDAGYQIRLVKTLQVKHLKRWTLLNLIATDFWQRAVPWTELLMTRPVMTNDLNISYRSRLSVALVLLSLLLMLLAFLDFRLTVLLALVWLLIIVLNARLYGFFWSRHGLIFMLKAIFWHWLYYFYSGLGYLYAHTRIFLKRGALKTLGVRSCN